MQLSPINPARFMYIDLLRGCAVVWMTLFHFCFDLNYLGLWSQNFYSDAFWVWQRNSIVGLFLFCAGLSQAIAFQNGQTWRRFWLRWGQIVACASLVSAGSYWLFPTSFIYFGVLHGMAMMLILVRFSLSCGLGAWLWLLGGVIFALQAIVFYGAELNLVPSVFNTKWLNGLGWISRKPVTEDYVPLLPWLGVISWGAATGRWWLAQYPVVLQGSHSPQLSRYNPLSWLTLLGRWSLSWYMVHQPILLGLLMAFMLLKA